MSLIRFDNVSKSYAGLPVLNEVNLRIEEGERVALIGRNGTGKTTLFRLVTGETEPDGGTVERMRRARVAYLAQIPEAPPDATVYSVALNSFADLLQMESELQRLEERMADGNPEAVAAYGEFQHAFVVRGGYEFRARLRQILCGVGFAPSEFEKPFLALSGGWRARLMLALALLREVDLLLLDEPENHLDMDAREWLEDHLLARSEAVVLISHDRRMVNTLAKRIFEVERGRLTCYTGNYDAWQKERSLRREQQQRAHNRQEAFIRKEQAWIDRFRYKNTKARQAQNRLRRLEKLDLVDAPESDMAQVAFALGDAARTGETVLDAQGLSMAYSETPLYKDFSLSLQRGERIGVIGPNGAGKTTLLRHLAGRLSGGSGEVQFGCNVKFSFYDQHQEQLNPTTDILSEMQAGRPDWSAQQCRSYLGRFLFTGDDVFKTAAVLSGGERSRIALAKLIASEANLLFLDEPTNHLDIASREALENSLDDYQGAVIVVSHDRALIDRLAERLIVVQDGQAKLFLGNFSDYRRSQQENREAQEAASRNNEAQEQRKPTQERREQKKAQEREARREQRRVQQLEEDIAALEADIADMEGRFASLDPTDYAAGRELKDAYDAAQEQLTALYAQWEQAAQ